MFSVSILETFGIALVIPIMSTILEQSSSIRAQLSIFVPYISQLTEREFVVLGILFSGIFGIIASSFILNLFSDSPKNQNPTEEFINKN